jgi:hypothetical protein
MDPYVLPTHPDPAQEFSLPLTFFSEPTQRLAAVVDETGMSHRPKRIVTPTLTLETIVAQGAPAAFEAVREEIAAVPTTSLVRRNLNIPRAARRGLMVAERIEPLHAELSTMSHLDHRKVETMPTYALALTYAHERVEAAERAKVSLADLLAQAVPLRADLMTTGDMLAHFGIVSPERMAQIHAGQGHADTAADLLALGLLLGGIWPAIENKVVVTREQVDLAIPLSAQLQRAIGVREGGGEDPLTEPSDARLVRAQALELFVAAYGECRRGVSHLRWHQGDAARIVPSLYPGRPAGRKGAVGEGVGSDASAGLLDASSTGEPARVGEMTADMAVHA